MDETPRVYRNALAHFGERVCTHIANTDGMGCSKSSSGVALAYRTMHARGRSMLGTGVGTGARIGSQLYYRSRVAVSFPKGVDSQQIGAYRN